MPKKVAKYAIFKQEEVSRSGRRLICVGYCVYEVATGARIRSFIPTHAMARDYRDRLNAEAAKVAA